MKMHPTAARVLGRRLFSTSTSSSSSSSSYKQVYSVAAQEVTPSLYSKIFEDQKPVVLRGYVNSWPALASVDLERQWSFESLKRRLEYHIIAVEFGGDYMSENMQMINIEFGQFMDYIKNGHTDVGHIYLAQQLLSTFPSLEDDIIVPAICRSTGKSTLYNSNLWIGPQGVQSPCHFDPFNNVLCQIIGRKRVVCFPQDQSEFLYAAKNTMQPNTSLVDINNPDLQKHPDFINAQDYGVEVEIERGDALFIPYKHWHFVESLSSSVSVNFWWL